MNKIKDYVASEDTEIESVLKKINVNGKGVIFIVDHKGVLLGSISDGDIRRWLLQHRSIVGKAYKIINRNVRFVHEKDKKFAYHILRENGLRAIPVLDDSNRIIDIVVEMFKPSPHSKELLRNPVVIMAGGKGTRLYPFTRILPKPLIPIGDTPIIERIMDKFYLAGIKDFFVIVNYKKEMIKSYFSEVDKNYNIEFVEEKAPYGTAGGLHLIKNRFRDPIIVTNCDTILDIDYAEVISFHDRYKNDMTIVGSLVNTTIPYGIINAEENGTITAIEEKPTISNFINTGMYVISPRILERIPDEKVYDMTDLVNEMIINKYKVVMYPTGEDSFMDMGEFGEMKKMESKLFVEEKGV